MKTKHCIANQPKDKIFLGMTDVPEDFQNKRASGKG